MIDGEIRRRYLLHSFFHKFTERLFFAFGALLIFAKTGSLFWTLMFALVGHVGTILLKSGGFPWLIKLFRSMGMVRGMTLGLFLKAGALAAIFYIDPGYAFFYHIILALSVVSNVGNTLYVTGANALMFEVIGVSGTPGRSSAQIAIFHTISGLLAAAMGILLGNQDVFLYSFLVGGAALLVSTLPLWGIATPPIPAVSFRANLKKISLSMFFANVNPDHEISVMGLPLVIFVLSASLQKSIWITAAIAIAGILVAYGAGWLRDHHGSWFSWLALSVGIVAWAAYGFVDTPIGFLIPSIFAGLA